MIETRVGNALDPQSGIIVHGCNCQGVMGSGIAREVKARFPEAFYVYEQTHLKTGLVLGEISLYQVTPEKIIVNANTQDTFGTEKRQVSYDAIAECFEKVLQTARMLREQRGQTLDIIFPKIGAGLGGGNWAIIAGIIDAIIPDDEFKKILYIPPAQ